jgi:hypothetical protein
VLAKVKSQNSIGWSDDSAVNSIACVIFVEPYKMLLPIQGFNTKETQIDVQWTPITEEKATGGSPIDSYNLQWQLLNSADDFIDLIGQDGSY